MEITIELLRVVSLSKETTSNLLIKEAIFNKSD